MTTTTLSTTFFLDFMLFHKEQVVAEEEVQYKTDMYIVVEFSTQVNYY